MKKPIWKIFAPRSFASPFFLKRRKKGCLSAVFFSEHCVFRMASINGLEKPQNTLGQKFSRSVFLFYLFFLLLSSTTWAAPAQFYAKEMVGEKFTVQIVLVGEDSQEELATNAIYAALERAEDYYQRIDRSNANGELAGVNRKGMGKSFISRDLAMAVCAGLNLNKKTKGWFDITSLAAKKSYKKIALRETSLHFLAGGITLNLDPVAQGLLADQIREDLKKGGWKNFLVKVGPAYASYGSSVKGPWRIAVTVPDTVGEKKVISRQEVTGEQSAATWRGGDPALYSITVIAPYAVDAQGIAQALYRMPPENRSKFLSKNKELQATFVSPQGQILPNP